MSAERNDPPQTPPPGGGSPELVVIAKPEAGLRVRASGIASETGADTSSLESVLETHGAAIRPLFGLSEDRLRAQVEALPTPPRAKDDAERRASSRPRALLPRHGRRGQPRPAGRGVAGRRPRRSGLREAGRRAAERDPRRDRDRNAQRHAARSRRRASGNAELRRSPGSSGRGAGWGRRAVRVDALRRAGHRNQDHRLRVGLALHARGPAPEPGRRRCRHEHRQHRPRHRGGRRHRRRLELDRRHGHRARRVDGSVILQRPVDLGRDQGGGRQARPRRHHPAGDSPSGAADTQSRAGPARVHRDRVVAGRLRRHPLRGAQGAYRRRSRRQRVPEPRRPDLRHAADRLSDELAQPVQPRQPVVRRGGRRCGRAAAEHARRRLGPGPLTARLLELRTARRRAGLGARGHDHRLRRPPGRPERGSLVHGSLLRHLERVAGRGRGARRHAGRASRPRPHPHDLRAGAGAGSGHGLAAAGRADAAGERADRQPAESPRADPGRRQVPLSERRLRRRRAGRGPHHEPVGHRHPRAGRCDDGGADDAAERHPLRRLAAEHGRQPLRPSRRLRR